jgi:hypothetical protein
MYYKEHVYRPTQRMLRAIEGTLAITLLGRNLKEGYKSLFANKFSCAESILVFRAKAAVEDALRQRIAAQLRQKNVSELVDLARQLSN